MKNSKNFKDNKIKVTYQETENSKKEKLEGFR